MNKQEPIPIKAAPWTIDSSVFVCPKCRKLNRVWVYKNQYAPFGFGSIVKCCGTKYRLVSYNDHTYRRWYCILKRGEELHLPNMDEKRFLSQNEARLLLRGLTEYLEMRT